MRVPVCLSRRVPRGHGLAAQHAGPAARGPRAARPGQRAGCDMTLCDDNLLFRQHPFTPSSQHVVSRAPLALTHEQVTDARNAFPRQHAHNEAHIQRQSLIATIILTPIPNLKPHPNPCSGLSPSPSLFYNRDPDPDPNPIHNVHFAGADEESRVRKLGRRSGTGQLAGSNFVLDALVEGETVAEVLQNAQHQVRWYFRGRARARAKARARARVGVKVWLG